MGIDPERLIAMSMRQAYALAALNALIQVDLTLTRTDPDWPRCLAKQAWAMADAMLEVERETGTAPGRFS